MLPFFARKLCFVLLASYGSRVRLNEKSMINIGGVSGLIVARGSEQKYSGSAAGSRVCPPLIRLERSL